MARPTDHTDIHRAEYLMIEPLESAVSWRDPDGFIVNANGRILRAVALAKAESLRQLVQSRWLKLLIAKGVMPGTVEIPEGPVVAERPGAWCWFEHDRLDFPCYPHEITALQLYDSGILTLQLAIEAVENGWMLKDASAWNVLHSQGRPVFVDLLSFEKRSPTSTWMAYGQFARHFLLPLLLYRKLGVTPDEVFLKYRDGIDPAHAYRMLRGLRLLSFTAVELVVLPTYLSPAGGRLIAAQGAHKSPSFGASMERELLLNTLRRLQRTLKRLCPDESRTKSTWKTYEENRLHYSQSDLTVKTAFIRENLRGSKTVLDLGCNAGEFSLLAADCNATVLAADADHAALVSLYEKIRGTETRITPLVLNIARPTPAIGWENTETPSFIERAAGQFDCILMLGLVHHLLVSERASLTRLAHLLRQLGPKRLILEWIDPQDSRFRQIAGLNADLYCHLTEADLERSLVPIFRLVVKQSLPSAKRVMYLWER